MRLVHFSHRGHKRFGVLISDHRVLDLTHFFRDESVLRSAGEDGLKTVREAIERAQLRRSVGGHLYSLDDVLLETPEPGTGPDCDLPSATGECATGPPRLCATTAAPLLSSGFGIHLVRKMRSMRR